MNILIPMAGSDGLFKDQGYRYSKSLIEISGRPLIEHVYGRLASLRDARFLFVIRKSEDQQHHLGDVLRLLNPSCKVIASEGQTAGAACTCLLAVEHINNDDELVITNGDQLLFIDQQEVIDGFRAKGLDAGAITFDSVHPRWSYVRLDEQGRVVEAAEKRPISRHATAGFYYFRRGRDFVAAAMSMIRKNAHEPAGHFVCPTLNELILNNARIGVRPVAREDYVSLARPEDVETYVANLTHERNRGAS